MRSAQPAPAPSAATEQPRERATNGNSLMSPTTEICDVLCAASSCMVSCSSGQQPQVSRWLGSASLSSRCSAWANSPPPSRRSKSQATGAGEVHVPRRAYACRVVSCHRLKHRQPSSARRQAPRVRPGRARNGPQACDSSLQLECVRPYFSTDPAARNIIFPSSFLFLSQSFRPEVSRGRERRMLRALGLASPMPRAQKAKTEDSDAEV